MMCREEKTSSREEDEEGSLLTSAVITSAQHSVNWRNNILYPSNCCAKGNSYYQFKLKYTFILDPARRQNVLDRN